MCSVSTPKPDQSAVDAANKKPQYLRNPWLDSLSIQGSGDTSGRNSLVIAPGTKPPPITPISTINPTPNYTTPNTNLGIGSGGGFVHGGGSGGFGINGMRLKQR